MQFAQGYNAGIVPGSNRKIISPIIYFKCNKLRNFADIYPDLVEADK